MAHLVPALTLALVGALVVGGTVATASAASATGSVATAQQLLNDAGCDAGRVDGIAGKRTRAATIRFQAANALAQTASLDSTTSSRLAAATKVRCDRRPVPSSSGTGRRIVVSRTQNYLWLVHDDGTVRWEGGIIDNPRVFRTGTYRTGSACGRPAHTLRNSDYGGRLRLHHYTRVVVPGACGVGFHRVPVRKDGRQIHADWLLGTNMSSSHGCIRVSARTAQEIWDFSQAPVAAVFTP